LLESLHAAPAPGSRLDACGDERCGTTTCSWPVAVEGGERFRCGKDCDGRKELRNAGMAWQRDETRARMPQNGTPAPACYHTLREPVSGAQNPAARSPSRSSSAAAGECSGLFSLKREGTSWRCLATVRLATMAAMATRLTPKVRIRASRVEDGSGASGEAPRARQASCVPVSCSKH
jgi:hypothetical protein